MKQTRKLCMKLENIKKLTASGNWRLERGKDWFPQAIEGLQILLKPLMTLILKPAKPIRGKTTGI